MKKKQIIFFFLDTLIVAIAFLVAAILKPATRRFYIPTYIDKVFIFLILWIGVSLLGNKYKIPKEKEFSSIVSNLFRNNFVILGLISFILFAFKSYQYSRLIVFGTLFITFFLEFLLSMIFYFHNKLTKESDLAEEIDYKAKELKIDEKFKPEKISFENYTELEDETESAFYALKRSFLEDYPKLFEWLDNNLPLKSIPASKTISVNTRTFYNIKIYEKNSLDFFINLHKVNDFNRINQFFIQVNDNLKQNGIFIGVAITNKEIYKKFINKYKSFLGSVFLIAIKCSKPLISVTL